MSRRLSTGQIAAASAIVRQVMADHGIVERDFFGDYRFKFLVDARRDAVTRLLAAGFNKVETASAIRRHHSTICNYTSASLRASKAVTHRRRAATLREARA